MMQTGFRLDAGCVVVVIRYAPDRDNSGMPPAFNPVCSWDGRGTLTDHERTLGTRGSKGVAQVLRDKARAPPPVLDT